MQANPLVKAHTMLRLDSSLDLPSDLLAAHDYIVRLEDEKRELERLAALSGDLSLAVNMAAECEEVNLSLRTQVEQLLSERADLQAQLDASQLDHSEALRRQLASALSAAETVRATVGEQAKKIRTLQSENVALQRRVKDLSDVAAFVDSDEGHELLHAAGFVMRLRRELRPLIAAM